MEKIYNKLGTYIGDIGDDVTETKNTFIEIATFVENHAGYVIKDSGQREEFATGSQRDTQTGKGDYSLISPIALRRLALHYEGGARKYGEHNWRKGQPFSRYISSALRHLLKWSMGWKDEDHLTAAAWNIFCLIDHEEMITRGKLPKELDDRYPDLLDDVEFYQEPV